MTVTGEVGGLGCENLSENSLGLLEFKPHDGVLEQGSQHINKRMTSKKRMTSDDDAVRGISQNLNTIPGIAILCQQLQSTITALTGGFLVHGFQGFELGL